MTLISVSLMFGVVLKASAQTGAQTVEEVKKELRETIALYVIAVAEEKGVDSNLALRVATCESNLNHLAIGDKGKSFGLWQIHEPSWPGTKEIALDPIKSTDWAMEHLSKGRWGMWSCWKEIYL